MHSLSAPAILHRGAPDHECSWLHEGRSGDRPSAVPGVASCRARRTPPDSPQFRSWCCPAARQQSSHTSALAEDVVDDEPDHEAGDDRADDRSDDREVAEADLIEDAAAIVQYRV